MVVIVFCGTYSRPRRIVIGFAGNGAHWVSRMELLRKSRQWNTKILTFSRGKWFDVTRKHSSFLSYRFEINLRDKFVNKIPQGCKSNARNSFRLASGKKTLSHMAPNGPKVVIIGAGAAGIAAASRLLENGINDLIVLEAENRIGGRILSVEFDGSMADLGAQWCHGQKDNIVYELAKDLNVLSPSYNNYTDFTFYLSDGTVMDKSDTDRLVATAEEVFCDEEQVKLAKGTFGDYFIKEYRKRVSEFLDDSDLKNVSELFIDWFHKGWMGYEATNSWFEVSPTGPFQYAECEGDLYLQWRDKGYRTIFDILTKKIPNASKRLPIDSKILLNKEVLEILWDSGNAVTVKCSDSSSYTCDHAIVTVSLGVLKNMSNCFEPKLPLSKQSAIEAMEIGNVHKVFLKFPSKWWPDDLKGFSLIWKDDDRKKLLKEFPHGPSHDGQSWLYYVYGFYVIDSHPRVLLGWVVGPMVEEVENLPDEIVKDGLMFLLHKFAGKLYNIEQPDEILRSKWKNNVHFNGCYTYHSLEADKRNVSPQDLASPVANSNNKQVLLFAGEATHSKYYSTVHGAIETGFREADRILNMYKSSKLIHRKVAIIGAGMAGLGAATTLFNLGCSDFVLIEAQNKPGGRIHTLTLDDNVLELGAQWIHGKDNPLYELARQHDLLSEVTSEEGLGLYIRDNGEIIDEDVVKRVDFEVGKILSECEEFVEAVDYPASVGQYMEERFMDYLNKCQDSDDIKKIKLELFDWHVRFQIIDNSCLNLKQLSAKSWGQYVCLDDKAHFNLKCGFDELVKILVDKLPKNSLLLSTPVAGIQLAHTNFPTSKIICDNGTVITCDHLIITPSLAILKRLKTTPPLPREVAQSIQDLGYFGIGKIFLIFEYKWWTEEGFQFIWRRDSLLGEENSWSRYITGFDPVLHGPTVLLGWVGGEGVKVMENLSDEDVGTQCMNLLRRFVRNRTIPDPVKVVRTTWCSNPWIMGGYSHITPACDLSGSGMHKLSKPIFVDGKPRILIAGEATHPSHYSTIHGAYESGQERAKLLAEYMMKNSKL